jgi:hypothetical protein
VDLARLHPLEEFLRRQVNQLDLVGTFDHYVGQRLTHNDAGDLTCVSRITMAILTPKI